MQQPDTTNYEYLAITANYWGSGKTEAEALRNCRAQDGGNHVRRFGYVMWRIHPDSQVSDVDGSIYYPVGHPAIRVKDARKNRPS